MMVLGSCALGILEQQSLADGASFELLRSRLLPKVLQRLRIGDLLWVQEPWFLYTSRQFGPQNIYEAVPGSPTQLKFPDRIKHIHQHLRVQSRPALKLARKDSRATLEVMGISEHSVRTLVHMRQVDEFRRTRAA